MICRLVTGVVTRLSNLKRLEVALLLIGAALLGFAAIKYIAGNISSRAAIAKFHLNSTPQSPVAGSEAATPTKVDFSLWSSRRIEEYKASLAQHFEEPVALLKLDRIHLEVPVFEGTDDRVLNRGAGRIIGTAHIGETGNVGIAGHRDSFFRGLKDLRIGDSIELESKSASRTYVIDSIKLVAKDDVSVLKSESVPSLTLVTCFPFYFVGSAPQRYIVHASLKGETKLLNEPPEARSRATASRTKESAQ